MKTHTLDKSTLTKQLASINAQILKNMDKGRTPEQIATDGRALFKDNAIAADGEAVFMPVVTIGLPVGNTNIDTKKVNDKANYDAGAGAAESFLNCVKAQAVSLKVYLQRIAETDQQWRKGFRVALDKARDDMRAHAKAREGMPDEDVFAQALRSALPRISEAIGFSKAVDAGFVPDMTQGYHAIIGAATAFRNSQSASGGSDEGKDSVGPTVKKSRGRKATPVLDKVKNYLLGLSLTLEQLEDVSKMVDTLVKVAKAQQQG